MARPDMKRGGGSYTSLRDNFTTVTKADSLLRDLRRFIEIFDDCNKGYAYKHQVTEMGETFFQKCRESFENQQRLERLLEDSERRAARLEESLSTMKERIAELEAPAVVRINCKSSTKRP